MGKKHTIKVPKSTFDEMEKMSKKAGLSSGELLRRAVALYKKEIGLAKNTQKNK